MFVKVHLKGYKGIHQRLQNFSPWHFILERCVCSPSFWHSGFMIIRTEAIQSMNENNLSDKLRPESYGRICRLDSFQRRLREFFNWPLTFYVWLPNFDFWSINFQIWPLIIELCPIVKNWTLYPKIESSYRFWPMTSFLWFLNFNLWPITLTFNF